MNKNSKSREPEHKECIAAICREIRTNQRTLGNLGVFGYLKYSSACQERDKRLKKSNSLARFVNKNQQNQAQKESNDLKSQWYHYGVQAGLEQAAKNLKSEKPKTESSTNKWNIPFTYRRDPAHNPLPPYEYFEEYLERRTEERVGLNGRIIIIRAIKRLQKYLEEQEQLEEAKKAQDKAERIKVLKNLEKEFSIPDPTVTVLPDITPPYLCTDTRPFDSTKVTEVYQEPTDSTPGTPDGIQLPLLPRDFYDPTEKELPITTETLKEGTVKVQDILDLLGLFNF